MKRLILVTALAAAFGSAQAAPVTFKANGDTIPGLATFDWTPSNVMAHNGNQAFVDFVNTGGGCAGTATGCNFDVYAHGKVSAYLDSANTPIAAPNLAAGNYELTWEMGFSENVLFAVSVPPVGPNIATFGWGYNALGGPAPAPFFRLYYDAAPNANDLAGTGFGNGTLILTGSPVPLGGFTSSFTTAGGAPVPLGGQGGVTPAPWVPMTTVTGSGSTSSLQMTIALANLVINDPTFFPGFQIDSLLATNLSQNLPFLTVDPSLTFPEGGIASLAEIGTVAGVNGGTIGLPGAMVADGISIMFQSDPNSPISGHPVPEPASLALLGLGLAGLGVMRRRAV